MSKSKANGCGPWFMGSWIPDGPKNSFLEACNQHDEDYEIGGTKLDRKVADKDLLESCLEQQDRFYSQKDKDSVRRWAYFYYYMVRIFGWMTFSYKR